ncbi:hypothetical protein QQ045_010225 [Rhodiola kirilowii]
MFSATSSLVHVASCSIPTSSSLSILTVSFNSTTAMKIPYKFKCAAIANSSVSFPRTSNQSDDVFMIRHGLVSRQEFEVKSHKINVDRVISFDVIFKHVQEAGINHFNTTGFHGGMNFGQTREMTEQNLSWVIANLLLFDYQRNLKEVCKIPDEISSRIQQYSFDCSPFLFKDSTKTTSVDEDSSDHVHRGLRPK